MNRKHLVSTFLLLGSVIISGCSPSADQAATMPSQDAKVTDLYSAVSAQSASMTAQSATMSFTNYPTVIAASTSLAYHPLVAENELESIVCDNYSTNIVVLLVDPKLNSFIRPDLTQFDVDLCNEGFTIIERVSNFNSPPEVRSYLANLYYRTNNRLKGAVIVGDIPRAYQWVIAASYNPGIPSTEEEVISFQYYSDLDGTFSASSDYLSPGNHPYSFDIHSGDLNWEIWIGLLPYYRGNITETVGAINRYFAKNHSYRIGAYNIPRAFLEINELYSTAATQAEQDQLLGYLRDGTFSWMPFSNSSDARLYVNGPTLSVTRGYVDLTAGMADFTVTDTHGWSGGNGQIDILWVESNPVKTIFFWSSGCAIGNIDQTDNFLTSIVYSPTSLVLFGKGTTNNSGGMGNNQNGFYGHNIAMALSQGENIGQAILSHVNVPMVYPWSDSREFHYATSIIVGDPTLKLRP